jgi:phage terminase large subunit-like protein
MRNFQDFSQAQLKSLRASLSAEEALALQYRWEFWARKEQLPPEGEWFGWLMLAGRAWGKTRTGAEYVRKVVEAGTVKRIGLVAETSADGRDVLVEGESGILECSPLWMRPIYEPSKRRLTWPNGVQATLYDAREPDQLRGPQHDLIWFDELAKYRYAEAVFDQAMLGLRLGQHPHWIATTTPRPIPLIKRLMNTPGVKVTRGRTIDNLANIAPSFKQAVIDRYAGTRLGRQELEAEILGDVPGALWTRRGLDESRHDITRHGPLPEFVRIVVSVDPSTSSDDNEDANEAGVIVSGQAKSKEAYVLDDWSVRGSPDTWARKAVGAYKRYSADCIVAEANQGGEMVRMVIQSVNENVPVKLVQATRGKYVRAEPISALYEQGLVHHVGTLPTLEDQMIMFTPQRAADRSDNYSPDRVDALVWGLTDLFPDVVEREKFKAPRVPAYQSRIPGMGMLS